MRHRDKKIKFKGGKDASDMIVRKMINNFLEKGKLTTTITKAKILKSVIESLIEKSKTKTESHKNLFLRYGVHTKLINLLFNSIGPALKNITGGYVRIARLGFRISDGANAALVEWAYPIVIETPEQKKVSTRKDTQSAVVSEVQVDDKINTKKVKSVKNS